MRASAFSVYLMAQGVTAGVKFALQNIPNEVVHFDIHTKVSSSSGVGNERRAGHMWPAAAFSVARRSLQQKSSNLRFPPT